MELSAILTHCERMDHVRSAAIASRLRHFREAMGYSGHGDKTRFCKRIGVDLKTYYHAERGTAGQVAAIRKIVDQRWLGGEGPVIPGTPPDVTEGWFLRGDTSAIPTQMALKLGLVRWKDNPIGLL